MARYETVTCDYRFPDGDGCGHSIPVRLIRPQDGWALGIRDYCPTHNRPKLVPSTR